MAESLLPARLSRVVLAGSRLLATAALGLLAVAPAAPLYAQPAPVAPAGVADAAAELEFPIPGGFFFTEAVANAVDGAGFAVQDGGGAQLWTAFQARGGVAALGYPISRRFDLDGSIAQAFQNGVLRWTPDAVDVVSVSDVPGRRLPQAATSPELPPRAAGEAAARPWSGWWWPASDALGPSLFSANSPLDKYDRYVELTSGDNPGTRLWERRNLYFPQSDWAGHCNGFAAAALLEPEPTEARDVAGITFGVADQKALLTDYHFGDAVAWTYGSEGSVNPALFHRVLLDWLGLSGSAARGFVLTFDLGQGEVWSYPVYRFASQWAPDPEAADQWLVTTTVWMADMNVPLGFVGLKPYPGPQGQTFEYLLQGDPRHPTDGTWTGASSHGRFSHPGQVWYPEPRSRNTTRELTSPGLDLQTIRAIIAGG